MNTSNKDLFSLAMYDELTHLSKFVCPDFFKKNNDLNKSSWPTPITSISLEQINNCPIYSGIIDFSNGQSNKISFSRFMLGVFLSSGQDGFELFLNKQKYLQEIFEKEQLQYELIKILNSYCIDQNIEEEKQIQYMDFITSKYPIVDIENKKDSTTLKRTLNHERFQVLNYFIKNGFKHYDSFETKNYSELELLLLCNSSSEADFIFKTINSSNNIIPKLNTDGLYHFGFWIKRNSIYTILSSSFKKEKIEKFKSIFEYMEEEANKHNISSFTFHSNTINYVLNEKTRRIYNSPQYIFEYVKWLVIKHPNIFEKPIESKHLTITIKNLIESFNNQELTLFVNLNLKNSINNNLQKIRF